MAKFIGTPEEFYDLFCDNLLTNAVKRYTEEYRKKVKTCQHKGLDGVICSDVLHAAHVNGLSRKSITMDILMPRTIDGIVEIDFDEFLAEFYKRHTPFHEKFLILCSTHHGIYDAGNKERKFHKKNTVYGMPKGKIQNEGNITINFSPNIANIIYGIRKTKVSYLHYHMVDGSIITKEWKNSRTEITTENIEGNIRSKNFYRDNRKSIVSVTVSMSQDTE